MTLYRFVFMTNIVGVKLENDLIIFGGGHAASIVICAAKKGLVKPKAIAAVAPTWAGPLPIVFGRDSSMETRYYNAPFLSGHSFSLLITVALHSGLY